MTQNVNTVTNVQHILLSKKQLDQMLFAILGSEELAHKWWVSPNKAFDDMFPKDVYYQNPQGRQEVSDYINVFASESY